MKEFLEFALVFCLALLVLGVWKLLDAANKRLLTGLDRSQPLRSNRFPLIPTKESERERNRPIVWMWALLDLFATLVILTIVLTRHR